MYAKIHNEKNHSLINARLWSLARVNYIQSGLYGDHNWPWSKLHKLNIELEHILINTTFLSVKPSQCDA